MVKKILVIIILFYILVLFQTSFLVHFDIFSGKLISYSLILVPIILISIFTPLDSKHLTRLNNRKANLTGLASRYDLIAAFSAGFFLDIFSGKFIGFHILILVGLVIFIKFILQKYVQMPIFKFY